MVRKGAFQEAVKWTHPGELGAGGGSGGRVKKCIPEQGNQMNQGTSEGPGKYLGLCGQSLFLQEAGEMRSQRWA